MGELWGGKTTRIWLQTRRQTGLPFTFLSCVPHERLMQSEAIQHSSGNTGLSRMTNTGRNYHCIAKCAQSVFFLWHSSSRLLQKEKPARMWFCSCRWQLKLGKRKKTPTILRLFQPNPWGLQLKYFLLMAFLHWKKMIKLRAVTCCEQNREHLYTVDDSCTNCFPQLHAFHCIKLLSCGVWYSLTSKVHYVDIVLSVLIFILLSTCTAVTSLGGLCIRHFARGSYYKGHTSGIAVHIVMYCYYYDVLSLSVLFFQLTRGTYKTGPQTYPNQSPSNLFKLNSKSKYQNQNMRSCCSGSGHSDFLRKQTSSDRQIWPQDSRHKTPQSVDIIRKLLHNVKVWWALETCLAV